MKTEKRLIDADALLNEIERIYSDHYKDSCYQFIHDFFRAIFRRIRRCPTVDAVEVVHGRWVLTVHEEQCNFRWNVTAECSECQYSKGEIYAGHFSGFPKDLVESMLPMYTKKVKLDNYCPNCGAKMDGDMSG